LIIRPDKTPISKEKPMKTLILCALAVSIAIPLAGCTNTAEGFGRDLEKAGQNIQKKV
jgi:predicted small secreted protein